MRRNKKNNMKLIFVILLLVMGLGFAAIATQLKITGTLNVSRTSWDVHFENVQITQGSVTANPAPTSNNTDTTEMTYTINFTKPGDYFEFTTDIVNDGTIDAMVDVVSNNAYQTAASTTPIALPSYLTNTVTYEDGVEIDQNQELLHGTSEKVKVRIEFKKDITTADLPSSGDTTVVFKFIADYKQADNNAVPLPVAYTVGQEVYFDPVTQTNCDSSTFSVAAINNNESTCYKWRVITTDDTRGKNKVTIQMDHNIINMSDWVTRADYDDDANFDTRGNTNKGPITALNRLQQATSTWTISNLTYTYDTSAAVNNYGTLTCTNGTCTNGSNQTIVTGLKARLITVEEVAEITRTEVPNMPWDLSSNSDFTFSSTDGIGIGETTPGNTHLWWLLENVFPLERTGGTANLYGESKYGYWTLSPVTDRSSRAWAVYRTGNINYMGDVGDWCDGCDNYGLRPVIEIEKTKLK